MVGYDGAWNVRDEERSVGQKKPEREQTEETKQTRGGFRGKTVWDWMALLIVPLVLVVIGLVFTMLQDARQQDLENQRAQQAQKIENQRAKAERQLAVQCAQDEALQAYLDQMSTLMLEKDLRNSEEDSEVRTLARARTVTVLQRLDADRTQNVTRFLTEAHLTGSAIGLLVEADLQGADLQGSDLTGADLSGANLITVRPSRHCRRCHPAQQPEERRCSSFNTVLSYSHSYGLSLIIERNLGVLSS